MSSSETDGLSRLTGFMKLHGEWATLMTTIIGLSLFLHHEDMNQHKRLDTHMTQINKRVDILHQEYFDLLKEMRKDTQ